jgi:hypothetical protein
VFRQWILLKVHTRILSRTKWRFKGTGQKRGWAVSKRGWAVSKRGWAISKRGSLTSMHSVTSVWKGVWEAWRANDSYNEDGEQASFYFFLFCLFFCRRVHRRIKVQYQPHSHNHKESHHVRTRQQSSLFSTRKGSIHSHESTFHSQPTAQKKWWNMKNFSRNYSYIINNNNKKKVEGQRSEPFNVFAVSHLRRPTLRD